MILKKTLIVPYLCVIAFSGFSQENKTAAKTTPQTPPKSTAQKTSEKTETGLLWEISGKGLKQPSFLYGTMHIVCEEDSKLSEGLKNALKQSKQVFLEVDLDDMNEMMSTLKNAMMTNGLKISDLVSAEEYIRIEQYFSENKSPIPFAMMGRFKPYFITALISESLMPCAKKVSIEQVIMTEAREADKEVSGLETMAFQASLFDSIPYEKQARDLVMYVDSVDNYRKIMADMSEMYRKEQINAMDSLFTKSDPGMSQYMDLLLYDRNKRWSYQIPEQAFEMPTLFAVGAGHLGGDSGVINLLRKQGFTLKALKN